MQKLKHADMLIMRNSDQNNDDGNRTYLYVKDSENFADEHGDRSGVAIWGWDENKQLWLVKRKGSRRAEYFKYKSQFSSFTAVDLCEVIRASFYNPSNNADAWNFKGFLEDQKKKFSSFKTAKSTFVEVEGVRDGKTSKQFKNVMWPPIDKENIIPIAKPLPDGSLREAKFWVYDDVTTTAVIRLPKTQIRLVEAKDLLKFGNKDIKRLSKMQIMCPNPLFEEAAKDYTSMIAVILDNKIWAGALKGLDVQLVTI